MTKSNKKAVKYKHTASLFLSFSSTGQIAPCWVSSFVRVGVHTRTQNWEKVRCTFTKKQNLVINDTVRNEVSKLISKMFSCLFSDSLAHLRGEDSWHLRQLLLLLPWLTDQLLSSTSENPDYLLLLIYRNSLTDGLKLLSNGGHLNSLWRSACINDNGMYRKYSPF